MAATADVNATVRISQGSQADYPRRYCDANATPCVYQ